MGVFCRKNLNILFVIVSLVTCLTQEGYCTSTREMEEQSEFEETVPIVVNSEKQQMEARMFTDKTMFIGSQKNSTSTSNNINDDNEININNVIPGTEINIEKIIETGVRTTKNNAYTNTKSRKFTNSEDNQENDNNTDETSSNSKTNNSYYFNQQNININFNNYTFNIDLNDLNDKDNGIVEYFGPNTENTRLINTALYKIQRDVNYISGNLTKITNDLKETKKENIFLKQKINKIYEENQVSMNEIKEYMKETRINYEESTRLLIEQNRLLKEQNEMYKKQTTNSNGFGFNFYTIVGTAVCITAVGVTYLVIDNLFFRDRRIKAIVNSIIDEKLQPIIANGINEIKTSINGAKNDIIRALPGIIDNTINERIVPTMNAINGAQQATIDGMQNGFNRVVNIFGRIQNMFNTRINTIVERLATITEPAITSTKTNTNIGSTSPYQDERLTDFLYGVLDIDKSIRSKNNNGINYDPVFDGPGAFGNFD